MTRRVKLIAAIVAVLPAIGILVCYVTNTPIAWGPTAGVAAALAGGGAAYAGWRLYQATVDLVAEAGRSTEATRSLVTAAGYAVAQAQELTKELSRLADTAHDSEWLNVHERLRPKYKVSGHTNGPEGEPYLIIRLAGPDALERLDEMRVSIVDDAPERGRDLAALAPNVGWLWSAYKFADTGDRHAPPKLHGVTRADWIVYDLTWNDDPRPSPMRDNPKWSDVVNNRRVKIEILGILRIPGGGRDHTWRWQGAVSVHP